MNYQMDSDRPFGIARKRANAQPQTSPVDGHRYVFGLEWASLYDGSKGCLAVMDTTQRQLVAMERFRFGDFAEQRGRIVALDNLWNPAQIWAEANSIGGPNIEALQAEGLPLYPYSINGNPEMHRMLWQLTIAFDRDDDEGIRIIPNDALLHQLESYSFRRLGKGQWRYWQPDNAENDAVVALMLAQLGLSSSIYNINFA